MTAHTVGVLDIGKSNAKVAIVDLDSRTEVAVRKQPNVVLENGPYPHFDVDGLWAFALDALAALNAETPVDALSITTHGAAAALIDAEGELALPVLDYEFLGPDELKDRYDEARPEFSESFTPRLPGGLNLGAQIFWQARAFSGEFERARWIVPYPQYWSHRLTGKLATEITSLGCHTDLWNFEADLFSSLVLKQGWLDRMPEVRPASDILGVVRPELGERLGFRRPIPVCSGIHDSNASLLPHLIDRHPPMAVISTGTWVITAAPGGDSGSLDPARDCLANLDVFGRPVPSARFMGGREFEMLSSVQEPRPDAVRRVLAEAILLTPSVVSGSGPFPEREAKWSRPRSDLAPDEVYAATSFYLALMTSVCLELAGAEGPIVVEGPFAGNRLFLEMLATAAERPVEATRRSATGTSIGAALLARMEAGPQPEAPLVVPPNPTMGAYVARWRRATTGGAAA